MRNFNERNYKFLILPMLLTTAIYVALIWVIPALYTKKIISSYPKMPLADTFCGMNGDRVQKVKAIQPFPLLKNPYMVVVAYGHLNESKSDMILCNSSLVVQISKNDRPSKERYNPFVFIDSNKRSVERLVFEDQIIDINFIEMQHNDGICYLSTTFKKFGFWFHLSTWNLNLKDAKLDRIKVLEEVHQLMNDIEP